MTVAVAVEAEAGRAMVVVATAPAAEALGAAREVERSVVARAEGAAVRAQVAVGRVMVEAVGAAPKALEQGLQLS